MTERAVPCNGCRVCCIRDLIVLHPECGDDVRAYDTMPVRNPITGLPAHALKWKPNGECIYLRSSGCSIYERRPAICRSYDCRRAFLSMSKEERRAGLRAGLLDRQKLEAGRRRLRSLEQFPTEGAK